MDPITMLAAGLAIFFAGLYWYMYTECNKAQNALAMMPRADLLKIRVAVDDEEIIYYNVGHILEHIIDDENSCDMKFMSQSGTEVEVWFFDNGRERHV